MDVLPIHGYMTDEGVRNSTQMQDALDSFRNVVAEMRGGSARGAKTISVGAITPDVGSNEIVVTSESSTSDDLVTITPSVKRDGGVLGLYPASGHTITLKYGVGANQIKTMSGADMVLAGTAVAEVMYITSLGYWLMVGFEDGDQYSALRTRIGLGTAALKNTGNSAGQVPLAETVVDLVTSYAAKKFAASPNGGAGAVTLRSILPSDLPGTVTGDLGKLMVGAGGSAFKEITGTALQVLRKNAGNTDFEFATLSGGAGFTPFESGYFGASAGGSATHGLGYTPKYFWITWKCKKVGGDHGYAENDLVASVIEPNFKANGTGVSFSYSTGSMLLDFNTSSPFAPSSANWDMQIACI